MNSTAIGTFIMTMLPLTDRNDVKLLGSMSRVCKGWHAASRHAMLLACRGCLQQLDAAQHLFKQMQDGAGGGGAWIVRYGATGRRTLDRAKKGRGDDPDLTFAACKDERDFWSDALTMLGEAYFNHPSVQAATTEAAMAAAEARREEDLHLLQAFGEAFSPTRLRTTEPPPLTDFKPSMMPPSTAKRLAMWQKKRQTTVLAHPPSTQVRTVGDMVQHMLEKARDAWHRRMCVAALHADFVKADAHVMFSDMLAVRAAVEALLILEAWRGSDEVSVPPAVAASYPETAEFAADTVRACSRESRGGTGRPGLNSKGMEKLYALLRCCSDYTLRAVRGALPVASPSPQVEELLAHITDLLEKAEQERSTQDATAETPVPTPAAAAAASGDGGGGDFLSILLSEQQPPPRARHLGYFASVDENAARRTLDKSRRRGKSLMALAGL